MQKENKSRITPALISWRIISTNLIIFLGVAEQLKSVVLVDPRLRNSRQRAPADLHQGN
jgi:hypothetical protein